MAKKKVTRRVILRAKKFHVEKVRIEGRGGRAVEREVVVHPGAVVVLAVEGDSVVMIRNRRFSVGKTLWELPAGTLEAGEPPRICAGRELVEETGYRAKRLRKLCTFYTSPGICTERMHAYLAEGLTQVGQKLEADEQIVAERVPRREVLAMIRDGRIEDGKTLAAFLYWHTL